MTAVNDAGGSDHAVRPRAALEPYVESWRVIATGIREQGTSTDATVRVRMGNRRLIASGEASDVHGALEAAVRSAVELLGRCEEDVDEQRCRRLREQCRLQRHDDHLDPACWLSVLAVHQSALLGRLTVLLNAYDIVDFSYTLDANGIHARIALAVRGSAWDVERVASKLRRVIGVISGSNGQANWSTASL